MDQKRLPFKNPSTAAFLSLILPGAGQLYANKLLPFLYWLVFFGVTQYLIHDQLIGETGILIVGICHLVSAVGAYRATKLFNLTKVVEQDSSFIEDYRAINKLAHSALSPENSVDTKIDFLAETIIVITHENAVKIDKYVSEKGITFQQGAEIELFFEMLIYFYHLINRTASNILSESDAQMFMLSLYLEIRDKLSSMVDEEDGQRMEFHKTFKDRITQREIEYWNCKIIAPEKDKLGAGASFKGTLFWDASKNIAAPLNADRDLTVILVITDIINSSLDYLELNHFFKLLEDGL